MIFFKGNPAIDRVNFEINGSLHWQETPGVNQLLDTGLELSRLTDMLQHLGIDKNHEVYRDLFRKMGYSLDGFEELHNFEDLEVRCDIPQLCREGRHFTPADDQARATAS